MKKMTTYGLITVFFLILATLVFRVSLGADNAFSASDANVGRVAGGQPEMQDMFSSGFGGSLLGTYRPPRFSFYSFLHALLPVYLFNDIIAPFFLLFASLCLVIFLRQWGRSWGAAVFGAVTAFWLGSSTLAAAGHYGKLATAAFFCLSLVLIEAAVRAKGVRQLSWGILAGVSTGLMLLSQQDIAMLFGTILGPYALFRLVQTSKRKPLAWVTILVPVAVLGLMLAGGSAQSAYTKNVTEASTVKKSAEEKWNFLTQWSFPPSEFPDLFAPGYMGWKTGHPDSPYWGTTGQAAEWADQKKGFQNFRLDSVYLGLIPAIFAITALIFAIRNKENEHRALLIFFGAVGLVTFILACGKFTPLYRLIVQLPLYGEIRAPIKFLHNLGILIGILSAFGIDAVLKQASARRTATLLAAGTSGLFLITAMVLSGGSSSFAKQIQPDWGNAANAIVSQMSTSSLYAAFSAGALLLLLKFAFKEPFLRYLSFSLCLFPIVDSFYTTSHYFQSEDIRPLRNGNAVFSHLKEHQGNQRVFTFDRSGVYNRWIGVEFPLHGINSFWFWQAPRLSQVYQEYLQGGSANLVALLQSSSVKYALAPVGALQQLPPSVFKPVMFYQFGMDRKRNLVVSKIKQPKTAQDQVLLELSQTLPRLSLFHGWEQVSPDSMNSKLFARNSTVMNRVLVDAELPASNGTGFTEVKDADWNGNRITANLKTEADAVLLFTQQFQPQWTATLNGEPADLFRCNTLSMGLHIPPGEHQLELKCEGNRTPVLLQLFGLLSAIPALGFLLVQKPKN